MQKVILEKMRKKKKEKNPVFVLKYNDDDIHE